MTATLKKEVDKIISQFDKKYETTTEEVDFLDVYFCADMYISLKNIIFAIENDLTFDVLYSWYYFELENMKINLRTYWKRLQDMPKECDIKDFHIYLLTEAVKKNNS